MDWINIEDDLPPYNTKVMCKSKDHERIGYLTNEYIYDRDYWCIFTSLILSKDVIQWRELTKEELRFSNTRQKD